MCSWESPFIRTALRKLYYLPVGVTFHIHERLLNSVSYVCCSACRMPDTWHTIKCKATFSPKILSHIRWLWEAKLDTVLTWSMSSYSSVFLLEWFKFLSIDTHACNKEAFFWHFTLLWEELLCENSAFNPTCSTRKNIIRYPQKEMLRIPWP